MRMGQRFRTGTAALLACQWEVTVPKPGNVHRGADFADTTLGDFLTSAAVISPILETAPTRPVGQTILSCVQATRQVVTTNTNLGIVLLLAPLAAVPWESDLAEGVRTVLANLSSEDARLTYEAIARSQAGGLGTVAEMDVKQAPPSDLLAAMRLAAERDDVARQYAEGFVPLFQEVVPLLLAEKERGATLTTAIIKTHLTLLANRGDSLVQRKCGIDTNHLLRQLAQDCLQCSEEPEQYHAALADFDFWLRSDGTKRNPGTTADLIAAALFVLFRDGLWQPPWK